MTTAEQQPRSARGEKLQRSIGFADANLQRYSSPDESQPNLHVNDKPEHGSYFDQHAIL
jgi:hypothetical protein